MSLKAIYHRLFDAVVEPGSGGLHDYLSTHCLHAVLDQRDDLHQACTAEELAPGVPRRPAQCKHCGSRCVCWCHA